MSIATEIQRLQNAKASIKTSIENKGVVVSSSDTLDDYSAYIDAINISTQEKTITVQNQTHEITADSGYRGLSKVILDGILVDAHDSYTSSTDSTTAYTKLVPSGALKYANLDKLGGMSYKSANLFANSISGTKNGVSYNSNGGITDLSNTATSNANFDLFQTRLPAGTYYFKSFGEIGGNSTYFTYLQKVVEGTPTTVARSFGNGSFTLTEETIINYIGAVRNGVNANGVQFKDMLVSGSTAPTEFQPYFTGIRDSAVTSVVSKDSNETILDTLTIPAEVQALEGYGWGVNDNCYNYIDFETKKFIQKVGKYVVDSNTEITKQQDDIGYGIGARIVTNSTIKTQGKILSNLESLGYSQISYGSYYSGSGVGFAAHNTSTNSVIYIRLGAGYNTVQKVKDYLVNNNAVFYYELATPVETDISAYLTSDNFIEVEAGGSITANNTYSQAVPSEITYLVEV